MNKIDPKFIIEGIAVKKGERKRIDIDMGSIYDFTGVKMPIEVIRGKKDGPTLFVCSTIHGDEINGIEIVKRLLAHKALENIAGTLIAIPIVNIFGFNDRTRYLPDRRDLNRCFPGLKNGSLASQVAYKFMQEIVLKSDYGIDLHTGAFSRCNHPQIRCDVTNNRTLALAKVFDAPVIVNSNLRDGSLRTAMISANIPIILFEAGEILRFDENNIKIGVEGILNVMAEIGMIKPRKKSPPKKPFIAMSSSWLRASQSGIYIPLVTLGKVVKKGEILGEISNPFGDNKVVIKAHENGVIIGISKLPLTNKGDALFHIACEKSLKEAPIAVSDNLENVDFVNL
jgi:predicted deacylase